jgi:hypothetical protein
LAQPGAAPEFEQTTPGPTDPDPNQTVDPGFMPESDEDGTIASSWESDDNYALADQWPECDTGSEAEQSTADTPHQTGHWAAAALGASGSDNVTESSQDAVAVANEMQSSSVGHAPPFFSQVPLPDHRAPMLSPRARMRAAVVAVVAIAGTGAFLLMQPTVTEVAAGRAVPANSGLTTSADLSVTGAATTVQRSTVAVPASSATAHPSEVAVSVASSPVIAPAIPDSPPAVRPDPKPAAAAPESHNKADAGVSSATAGVPQPAPPPAISPVVPARPSAAPAQDKLTVANLETPDKKATAIVPAAPDRPAPAAALSAVAPALPEGAPADRQDPRAAVASLEAPKNAAAIVPSASPTPGAGIPAATTTLETAPPKEPSSATVETAPLLERGDRLFGIGDIASARLFYERAADAGEGQAALRLGETYDPAFLERAQLRVPGDRALAVFWYRRARELGASEAEILLKGAQAK